MRMERRDSKKSGTCNIMRHRYETKIQARTTEEVVKEKRCLKKASDITEQILILVDSYKHLFNEKDLDKYEKLKKKFLKVN